MERMFTRCSEDAVSSAQNQKLHVPCNINQSALLPLRSPALRCQARQEEIKKMYQKPLILLLGLSILLVYISLELHPGP